MAGSSNSILKFQEYCTSPLFTILAGEDEISFTVHSALLRDKSPMFRAIIDGKWAETETGVIRWENWEPETVASFVQWIYAGEYECILPPDISSAATEKPADSAGNGKEKSGRDLPQPDSGHAPQSTGTNENSPRTVAISTSSGPDPNHEMWLSQNNAIQTSASSLQNELNSMKTNNEAAISATIEALSRFSLSAAANDSESSETSKDLHVQLAELSALLLAMLREQQKDLEALRIRDRAEEVNKSVARRQMEARAARYALIFAQRKKAEQDRADENTREIHCDQIVKELQHELEPTDYKFASNRSLPNNQLTDFESYTSALINWSRLRDINFDSALLQHLRVYTLAQYTETPDLEEYAFHALHIVLKAVEDWMECSADASLTLVTLIEAVYELTPTGRLRALVAQVATWNHRTLLGCLEYTDLLSSGGDFVVDLALNLGKSKQAWGG